MPRKSADAFRTISEVADWLETPAHVLRFWESKFSQVKPVKRAGGRRYYRPTDMKLLGGIKKLLHDDGMTIKGAQKLLRENGIRYVAAMSQPLDEDLEQMMAPAEPNEPAVVDDAPVTAEVLSFSHTPRAGDEATAKDASDEANEVITAEPGVAPDEDSAEDPSVADKTPVLEEPPVPQPSPHQPTLPSFLSRSPETETPQVEAESAPEGPPSPAIPEIFVPADPTDDSVTAEPGILSYLSKRPKLVGKAASIAPLAAQLTELRDKMAETATG